jgi:homoserine kinase
MKRIAPFFVWLLVVAACLSLAWIGGLDFVTADPATGLPHINRGFPLAFALGSSACIAVLAAFAFNAEL